MVSDFFKVQTQSSRIKANIVAEYFPQYCNIILKQPQNRVIYLDLFAGPGKYDDGNHSTPLLIAKACANNQVLSQHVHLLFNDYEQIDNLKKNFYEDFPEGTFRFEPRFANKTVGEDSQINNFLTRKIVGKNPHPTLLFFDPWGYKGIDTKILCQFLQHWGNELFLFVNIKRINQAMEVGKFDEMMKSLFPTTIETLRKDRKYKASVHERLSLIMEHLSAEFKKEVSNLYHCEFKFQEEDSHATSHYIVHFTKHSRGYELVKQVYYDYDNIGAVLENGVYTFDAKQAYGNTFNQLFTDENVIALSKKIEDAYTGRKITAEQLYNEHHTKTKYCRSHYVNTLRDMVEKGKVIATFTDNTNHKKSVLLTPYCSLEFK